MNSQEFGGVRRVIFLSWSASGTILHYDGDYDSDGILDVDDKCPDVYSHESD